jgi:hypothetical protein
MESRRRVSEPLDFRWVLPASGFEWRQCKGNSGKVELTEPYTTSPSDIWALVACRPRKRSFSAKAYRPLREFTGLFRTFADTKLSKEGILQFANTYGRLGGELGVNFTLSEQEFQNEGCAELQVSNHRGKTGSKIPDVFAVENQTGDTFEGEPIEDWRSEISEMRATLRLWEALLHSDMSELKQVLRWEKDGVYYVNETVQSSLNARHSGSRIAERKCIVSLRDPVLSGTKQGDVVTPGWFCLQQRVNDKLKEHLSSTKLLWSAQNHLELTIVPRSLISALWLQLARAVEGNRSYRSCEFCQRWFEVGAEVRADAKYCKNACRQKAYRRHKENPEIRKKQLT